MPQHPNPRKLLNRKTGLFVILVLSFLLFLHLGIRSTRTNQIKTQQEALALAQASNLEAFFSDFGTNLTILAQTNDIKNKNAQTLKSMETFYSKWKHSDIIGGLVFVDSQGNVQYNVNSTGVSDTGGSLADREYYFWAKDKNNEGQYHISSPVIGRVGAAKGESIVVVSTPVYKDDVFLGFIGASVKIEPLLSRYVGLLSINEKTEIYLSNEENIIIYSNNNLKGSNVAEIPPSPCNLLLCKKIETTQQISLKNHQNLLILKTPLSSNVFDYNKVPNTQEKIIIATTTLIITAYILLFIITPKKLFQQTRSKSEKSKSSK